MNKTTCVAQIQKHIGFDDIEMGNCVLTVYDCQAQYYGSHFHQYALKVDAVFQKSVAFRNWFNHEKQENDALIWQCIQELPRGFKMTPPQYIQMQKFYFQQRLVFPGKAVIELAVQEYKNRVSQSQHICRDEPFKP